MHGSGGGVGAPALGPLTRRGAVRAAVLSAPSLVLGYALLSGLLLGAALYHLRGQALRTGEKLTGSLAQVIAEQSTRTLQAVDQRLEIATTRLDALDNKGQLNEESARIVLREQLRDIPFARALWVIDMSGRIVLDSDVGNIGVTMADRDYFQRYQRQPDTEFATGPLVRSRSIGTWLMSATRPWRDASGQLRGVIVAAIMPGYFEDLWRGIDLGQNGAVVLFRRDGQLMVRSPPREGVTGSNLSKVPLFTTYLPRAPEGIYTVRGAIDGRERVTAYRVLPQSPELIVVVGSDVDDLLAPWRRLAAVSLLLWGLSALAATALGWQLQRQQRHRRSTEARFLQLAQAMPQVVFMSNRQGEAEFINDRWSEATGRPAREALGMGWLEQMHPDDRQAATATMARMMRTGEVVQHEHRMRYADGSYRWQLLRAVPNRGRDGQVVSWYGTSTDIDALKQAQSRLEAQAESLTLASRLARLGAWSADLATQRVTLSDEAAVVLDIPPGSTPTLAEMDTLVAPESRELSAAAVRRCIAGGEPFDMEIRMITPAGRSVWLRSLGVPVRGPDGRVAVVRGAQQDITDRVALMAEVQALNAGLEQKVDERTRALARQEAVFRTLAENAPWPIWMVDPRGAVTFLSRAWYDLVGGSAPQYLGYDWLPLMHPDDVQEVQRNWVEAAHTGNPHTGTRRIRAQDGTWHTTLFRAVPVRDLQGQINAWVGLDTDITERVAAEASLKLANAQLEAFSYSVSHDLRSPLERVALFAQLLEAELGDGTPPRARHYLARLRANADTMAQLIDGMMALAQVSQMEMVRGAVNLSELATEVLNGLRDAHPQRRVRWQVEPGLTVQGDVRLMRSVMDNLIGNAWKFTGRQDAPEIVVGGCPEHGEFFVRDNGAGFDMAYADKLFGTFQRLHRDDEFPGTGIGLATVARAISRQGGTVRAEARLGEGATFFFTMPAVPAS